MTIGVDGGAPYEVLADALLRVAVAAHGNDADQAALLTPGLVDDLAAGRRQFRESLEQPSMLTAVAWQARLQVDEAEVLAFLLAYELDPARQEALTAVPGSGRATGATLAALRAVFPPPHFGVLAVAVDARLRRAELVAVDDDGAWSGRVVRLAPSVTWAFLGDGSLDPDLPHGARFVAGAGPEPDAPPLILVNGADRESRLARAAASLPVRAILAVPCPATAAEWRATIREATLRSVGIVAEIDDELPVDARYWLERADHLAWCLSSPHELPLESLPERAWREDHVASGEAGPEEWAALVGVPPPAGYQLDRHQLRLVAAATAARADVVGAVRRLAGGHLERLTTRIRPRRGWDDLVLAPDQMSQVRQIADRYRYRRTVYGDWGFSPIPSSGVVALLFGPSGTGKTLTAEVIAGDLGLDLFKLDLSAVVSKYIGETEKNLEAVFRAAEAGEGVLFFDEADAVFGRRSEVTDARDRYANIESAYLLQRIERTDALVVLATNLPRNIDEAFLRRIHVSMEFRLPDEAERRRIWERAFPPDCPRGGIDIDRLAAVFPVAGGPITGAAISAAFLAASEEVPVSMVHVARALRAELRKVGRLVNDIDFSTWLPDVV